MQKMFGLWASRACIVIAGILSTAIYAEKTVEPRLSIGDKSFSRAELLSRGDLEEITIKHDPNYSGSTMRYKAIKARNLFRDVKVREDEVIQFRCADGYAAPISKERMLSEGAKTSTAYIAIEEPSAPWPELPTKAHQGTAGPFYLVWDQPEALGILPSEWPFKLAAFEVKGLLRELYPKIFPVDLSDRRIAKGFKLFQSACFACHTINGQGASDAGPDLNLPMNPTEYFKEYALKRYIRNPKSLRAWKKSEMPEFAKEALTDDDIENIICYLKVMARDRAKK